MTKQYMKNKETDELFEIHAEGVHTYIVTREDDVITSISKADARYELVIPLTIRETLKQKFSTQLDKQCDKGEKTYGHTLDDASDDDFDWRDMLIEELIDGLQYQEKEIKRLKEQIAFLKG